MILACPRCKKRFLLDASLLGTGRRVKCGNCGNIWHQEPLPPESQRAAGKAAPGKASGAKVAAGKPAAPAKQAPAKPAPKPPPPPPPPPPPLFGDDLAPRSGPGDFASSLQDDFSRSPESPRDDVLSSARVSNLPALADDEQKPKWVPVLRWGGLAAVIACLGAGLFFGRVEIVQAWPPANALYDLVGLGAEPLGAGLSIPVEKTRVEVRDIAGNKLLFVTGEIVNVSDQPREVPDVLAEAIDKDGKPLFSWTVQPSARRIFPGQSATFENPVPERGGEAKSVVFTFTPPKPPEPDPAAPAPAK